MIHAKLCTLERTSIHYEQMYNREHKLKSAPLEPLFK